MSERPIQELLPGVGFFDQPAISAIEGQIAEIERGIADPEGRFPEGVREMLATRAQLLLELEAVQKPA